MTTAEHEVIILGDGAESESPAEREPGERDSDTLVRTVTTNGDDLGERWTRIQGKFVDDPRNAVGEAHELVGELVQRITDGFAEERGRLESQWSKGDNVSTEDLRVCLQRYREFFSRLLPAVNGNTGAS
jgi:hypothetical protein